jgi:hypothetical protein
MLLVTLYKYESEKEGAKTNVVLLFLVLFLQMVITPLV